MTTQPAREHSLVEIAALVLRRRKTLILTPLVVTILAVAMLLVRGRRYSAESAFRPQVADASQGRFAGIAAQLGLSLPGAAIGDPVRFYAELAKSRDLLRTVTLTEYHFLPRPSDGDSLHGNLVSLFKVKASSPEESLRISLGKLSDQVEVTTVREAGLVRIKVVTPWPELSVLINRRILSLIDEANLVRRQSQAGAERKFIEGRVKGAQEELAGAERSQERFLLQNRRYQDSPQLMLQYNQLQRRVEFLQQVFTGLSQSFEQARIDEVRDTPQLTIIDQPEGSARRAGSRAADAIMWLLIGTVLGIVLAIMQEALAHQRANDPQGFADVSAALRRLVGLRRGAEGSA